MQLTLRILDTSVYPSTATLITALGTDITVNGVTTNDVNTVASVVTNDSTVTISVTRSNHHTYTNTIQVFDYDMTINIFLVPVITNSGDPDYQRPFTYFNKYIKPCSYNVYCIDGSSFTASQYNYYLDRTVVATDRNAILNFLCPGDFQIGFEKLSYINNLNNNVIWWDEFFINTNQTTYNAGVNNQTLVQLFDNDTSDNLTVEEYKPELTYIIEVEGNACAGGDCDCIPQDSTITVTPTVVLNLNNQTTPTCATSTLTYNLYNYEGTLVDTQSFTIDNTIPVDNSALVYTATIAEIGDYTLSIELENCCATCTKTTVLHVCNFLKIEQTSCHVFTIKNCSNLASNDAIVTVTNLDNEILEGYDDVTLDATTSITLTTPSDGLYIVIVKDINLDIIEQFVVIDICDLINCLQTKIQELLCECDCKKNTVDCTDYCKKRYTLNAISAIAYSLFNKINQEYRVNSIYSVFDPNKLATLFTMKDQIDKLNSYCGCTGNNDGNGVSIMNTSTNSNCGCS